MSFETRQLKFLMDVESVKWRFKRVNLRINTGFVDNYIENNCVEKKEMNIG